MNNQPILEQGEELRDIPDYEGIYAITTHGRVWSYPRVVEMSNGRKKTVVGRWLKANKLPRGKKYALQIQLKFQSQTKIFFVSRLVAQAFIPNQDNKPEVDHLDGDSENNHVSNLKWVTKTENRQHETATGIFNYSDQGRKINALRQKLVTNETGQVYKSATFASLLFGKSATVISSSIHLKCRCAGHSWSYVNA